VLRAVRQSRAAGAPLLLQCGDEQAQSRFVTQRILELREEGVSLDEMAVLFRSSFLLRPRTGAARRRAVRQARLQFIETAHVKDVLAPPDHREPADAVSWHRVLLLLDGVG
jgi:DNA helicase-2/ATP-dependent DNA helicase PcrA